MTYINSKKFWILSSKLIAIIILWGFNTSCFDDYELESYRFHLFNENTAKVEHNKPFYYTLNFLNGDNNPLNSAGIDENLEEWYTYLGKVVSKIDINEMLYGYWAGGAIDEKTGVLNSKEFLEYYSSGPKIKKANNEAYQYMIFAKRCEYFLRNDMVDQYQWNTDIDQAKYDREEAAKKIMRTKLIKEAQVELTKTSDAFLKTRYAYQVIVLSRYNEDLKTCQSTYVKYIENNTQQSVINYWAMLHYAEKCLVNVQKKDLAYARVFKNSIAKRYRTYLLYNKTNPTELISLTKGPKDQAAIWTQAAVHDPGRSLTALSAIYALDPNDKDLAFLFSREINKIEHWLYTNRLTNAALDAYDYNTGTYIKQNLEDDKKYTNEVISLAEKINDEAKVKDKAYWNLALGHLYFLIKENKKALSKLETALTQNPNPDQLIQIKTTRILCFDLDQKNNAGVEEKIYQDLVDLLNMDAKSKKYVEENDGLERKYSSTDQLIAMVAYKFEENKEIVRSALLLSHCAELLRMQKKFISFWMHYDDYFFYLDEMAGPQELKYILDLIEKPNKTNFESYLISKAVFDKYKLMDLYGTMQMREEKYTEAAKTLNQIPAEYWHTGVIEYDTYLDANPMHADFYSGHSTTAADTIRFTKVELLNKIIELQNNAASGKNAAMNYFTLGNIFYNMTHHGNSWMMMRYGWSTNEEPDNKNYSQRVDEANYYGGAKAIYYYKKAADASKNKKFSALCLRMVLKCDEFRDYMTPWYDYEKERPVFVSKYKTELIKNYPNYYDELLNDCGSFYRYMH